MTNSTFPLALDLDANLYRVTPASVVVPDHHNNLVDAIEQSEATIGVVADGSQAGGTRTWNTGLAHFVQFPSIAMPNPRFPWAPPPANAWYGASRAAGTGWTFPNGLTPSYTRVPGYAYLPIPAVASQLQMLCPITGAGRRDVVIRFAVNLTAASAEQWTMGFSQNGLGTDIDGIHFRTGGVVNNSFQFFAAGAHSGSASSTPLYGFMVYWFHTDGTTFSIYRPMLPACLNVAEFSVARAGLPGYFALYTGSSGTAGNWILLDFASFGNTDPSIA